MNDTTIKKVSININKKRNLIRKNYTVDFDTAEKWEQFVGNYSEKTLLLSEALNYFMEEVVSGSIKFELCFGKDSDNI